MNSIYSKLTLKQELFCQKYLIYANATKAYKEAYDCAPDAQDKTACNEGYLLLQNPDVAQRVEELELLRLKRNQITADRVLVEMGRLAFSDIRGAFYPDGTLKPLNEIDDDTAACIAGLEIEERRHNPHPDSDEEIVEIRVKKIKIADKKGALDSLGKHLGIIKDSVDLNVGNKPGEVFEVTSPDVETAAAKYNAALDRINAKP